MLRRAAIVLGAAVLLAPACGRSVDPEAARSSLCLHLLPLRASFGPVLPQGVWEDLIASLRLDAVALREAGLAEEADRAERLAGRLETDARPGETTPDLSVFLLAASTSTQRSAIEQALNNHPDVASVDHETKDEAFTRFLELFGDNPDVVEGITADAMPESFRVDIRDGRDLHAARVAVSGMAGVEAVREGGTEPVILTFDVAEEIEPLVQMCPDAESGPP